MPQTAQRGIGDRRVAEQDLPRREAARVRLAEPGPHAEERHLETERRAALVLQPAGDVPPLDAEVGMRAVVLRELQVGTGQDRRVAHFGTRRGTHAQHEQQPDQQGPRHHQSSFTARTTSSPIAWRPLTTEVSAAAATSTPLNTASSVHGTCTSMVQWNDWRLTT